jgi:hypothetical protein
MKTITKLTCVVLLVLFGTAVINLRADEKVTPNPFLGVLSTATSAELPAKAAGLVSKADSKIRQQTTIDVVKAAVGLNPAAAAVIVGTIAQSTPEMAAMAAGTAAGLVPDQVEAIARAAAAAAPKQAGKIVEAICKVVPSAYQKVALAVAEVVPGAGKEILAGIAVAIPSLKGTINQILIAYKDSSTPSVSAALNQVALSEKSDSGKTDVAANGGMTPLNLAPTFRPPFIPPPGFSQNLNPNSGGVVPPGGRNYAAP